MAERFKFNIFDRDLLKAVSGGESDLKKICSSLGVDWKDFQARAALLAKKGFVVLDEADPTRARLGVEGYNALHSDVLPKKPAKKITKKKLKEKALASAEGQKPLEVLVDEKSGPKLLEPPSSAAVEKAQDRDKTIDIPYNPLIHGAEVPLKEVTFVPVQAAQEAKPKAVEQRASEIDLVEVFEKYGVKKKQAIKEKLSELSKAIEDKPLSTTLATIAKEGKYESNEKCDLCKASFRLSLSKDNHPKYGHCFCGAAYHKDCYESLLDNGGKCVRCGKKLVLMLDRQSEDAIKAVKKLFE